MTLALPAPPPARRPHAQAGDARQHVLRHARPPLGSRRRGRRRRRSWHVQRRAARPYAGVRQGVTRPVGAGSPTSPGARPGCPGRRTARRSRRRARGSRRRCGRNRPAVRRSRERPRSPPTATGRPCSSRGGEGLRVDQLAAGLHLVEERVETAVQLGVLVGGQRPALVGEACRRVVPRLGVGVDEDDVLHGDGLLGRCDLMTRGVRVLDTGHGVGVATPPGRRRRTRRPAQLNPIGIGWPLDTISLSRSMHWRRARSAGSFDTDSARVWLARACCSAVMTDCSAMRVWATWARRALTLLWVFSSKWTTGMMTDRTLISSPIWSRICARRRWTGPPGPVTWSCRPCRSRAGRTARTPRSGRRSGRGSRSRLSRTLS